jgi:hypothetical protein
MLPAAISAAIAVIRNVSNRLKKMLPAGTCVANPAQVFSSAKRLDPHSFKVLLLALFFSSGTLFSALFYY